MFSFLKSSRFGWFVFSAGIVALLGAFLYFLFSDTKVVGEAGATQIEYCNHETTYEKSSDYSDSRIEIDFINTGSNGNPDSVKVEAKAGYQLVKVELNVENDNQGGYVNYTANFPGTFNPTGEDIEEAKVKVKKVCASPTPSVSPTPSEEPEVTPTPTDEPNGNKTEDKGNGQSVCENPNQTVANFHVYRNGENAILKWFKTAGDKVNIYWENINDTNDKHALAKVDNSGYKEIGALGNKDWRFGVQQECGQTVWVDDGLTNIWRLWANPYVR